MDRFLERVLKAPLGAKIGAVAAIVALVTVVNYFVVGMNFGAPISDLEEKIRRAVKEQQRLDKEYIEKTAIANNLNQFRREKELLEQQLREALNELPEDKNIEDLLQLFQDRALKAGLKIDSIEPKPASTERFYARIPIPMSVKGNYHEIATFFDALGRMRRIVNVSEVVLDSPRDVNGKVMLNGKFLVTAFMFVDPAKQGAGARPAGGAPAPGSPR
ncbi:MAG TPA: type 4a pilus biogenesis protein PilO [Anaeromyxobacter sp.]|nr:type 4a pilus biogenesis protein PilO [Anaeromyxobacter sp.]